MKVVDIGKRKNMLKLKNGSKVSWYKVNASNTDIINNINKLKVGDSVHIQYTELNGAKNITDLKIEEGKEEKTKPEATTSQKEPKQQETKVEQTVGTKNNFGTETTNSGTYSTSTTYTCKDCGKALKDNKYERCYTCNQKRRNAGDSDKNNSIRRQAMGHMTSVTVAAMIESGKFDITSTADVQNTIKNIYDTYVEKVVN